MVEADSMLDAKGIPTLRHTRFIDRPVEADELSQPEGSRRVNRLGKAFTLILPALGHNRSP